MSFGDWLEYTCAMVGALLPVGVLAYCAYVLLT
jgi:hypothetical protein